MQFRLHINDTNDGTAIAAELSRLAWAIKGATLHDGFKRNIAGGYAEMDFENGPEVSDGCDHEGFKGGCVRFGHTPATCPNKQ
jgi:hypothetical protein